MALSSLNDYLILFQSFKYTYILQTEIIMPIKGGGKKTPRQHHSSHKAAPPKKMQPWNKTKSTHPRKLNHI